MSEQFHLTPITEATKAELLELIERLRSRFFRQANFDRDLQRELTQIRLDAAFKGMDSTHEEIMRLQKERRDKNLTGRAFWASVEQCRKLQEQWDKFNDTPARLMLFGKYEPKAKVPQ